MNKLYISLLVFLIFITGCNRSEQEYIKIIQAIENLDMNIYSNEGIKIFSIKSPYSNYEANNNIFNLKKTTIQIFNDNKEEYIINANKSKLSNNKLLELNGNVLIENTLKRGDILSANNFTWNIQNSKYILLGNVKFENYTIKLSSNKAILDKSKNIIEFFNPVKYIIKDNNNLNRYEIKSENAYYNIGTNSINFKSKEERVRSKIYF